VEVWIRGGLQHCVVLFFIDFSSRRVKIAGIGTQGNGLWMSQIGRNQSDPVDDLLVGKRYLIHDRDPRFTAAFLEMLADIAIQSVNLPPRSPNLKAYAERFVRTIKESCLDRRMLFGEGSLRKAIREFVAHYHLERNHQGLGNWLITPEAIPTAVESQIEVPRFLLELVPKRILFDERLDKDLSCSRLRCSSVWREGEF